MEADAQKPMTAEDYLNIAYQATGQSAPKPMDALQAEVNELVKQVTVSEDGKFVYPSNTPEHLKLAVAAEKKFRDTQAGFTKSQQQLKAIEAHNKALEEELAKFRTSQGIPKEELEKLEDLKYEDPETWYVERQRLEAEAAKKHTQVYSQEQEIRNRQLYLAEINVGREIPITPDLLDNDIPARINKKLINRELSFEDYIGEVIKYLDKGKVVANPEVPGDTKLNSGTVSHSTPQDTLGGLDYSKITF